MKIETISFMTTTDDLDARVIACRAHASLLIERDDDAGIVTVTHVKSGTVVLQAISKGVNGPWIVRQARNLFQTEPARVG